MGRQVRGVWRSHTKQQKLSLTRMKRETLKKKTGIEGTVTDFAIRWAALKELGRWVEKEGGLGLVCREGLEATSGQVEKQEAFKL